MHLQYLIDLSYLLQQCRILLARLNKHIQPAVGGLSGQQTPQDPEEAVIELSSVKLHNVAKQLALRTGTICEHTPD